MSGIAGWFKGDQSESAERVIERLSEGLKALSDFSVHAAKTSSAGLTISGPPHAVALVTLGSYSIAILGRARWENDSQSGTELEAVCRRFIEGYASRGSAALQSLRGEFALVLIDEQKGEALLAIDRFGVGALIYQSDDNGLLFGSTCDLVLTHPAASHELDPQSLYNYTYFHVVPGPRTIFSHQHRVPPGHCVHWSRGKRTVTAYWTMAFREEAGSVADFKPPFRQALREAVARSAQGAECGAFLSGGTDSSTVAGLLGAASGHAAKTYSIGFAVEGYDEMEYARIAAKHFGTEHHEYYVTADDVVEALPRIVAAYDQPFGNASAVAVYYCAKLAKADGVTRMLAGDGGDEFFGGNSRYAKQFQLSLYDRIPESIRKSAIEPLVLPVRKASSFVLIRKMQSYVEQAFKPMPLRYESYNLLEHIGVQNIFTPEFLSTVDVGVPLALLRETHDKVKDATLINQMLGIDFKFTLADSDLPKVTRMCDLAGIEVAFPMMDEQVVELSARLPANLKLRGTRLRYFFKEALRDFLPGEILTKRKQGFGLPVGAWLTTHPRLSELARDSLSSLKRRGIVAPEFIDRLLSEHLRAHAAYFGTMAWVLMMLELWFQKQDARRR